MPRKAHTPGRPEDAGGAQAERRGASPRSATVSEVRHRMHVDSRRDGTLLARVIPGHRLPFGPEACSRRARYFRQSVISPASTCFPGTHLVPEE